MQKYVRIQGRELSYITKQPKGIFSMCWRMILDGIATEEEKSAFEQIDAWFKENLVEPPQCKNGEKVITYFKTATTDFMLEKLKPALAILDAHNHPYDVVYTNYVGKIVYEDEYQVAVSVE